MGIKVGSFTKRTSTGTQTVSHGLGETPEFILLFSIGSDLGNTSAKAGYCRVAGMWDGSGQVSRFESVKDNVKNDADALGRQGDSATKIYHRISDVTDATATANLQSTSSTDFTLNWTAAGTPHERIFFIAGSGPDIQAKIVTWSPSGGTGNQAVTGAGFAPDCVLHLPVAVHGLGLGVQTAESNGTTGKQWALWGVSQHGQESPATNPHTRRKLSLQASVTVPKSNDDHTMSWEAEPVSLDADGFTLNVTISNSQNRPSTAYSLCLAGVNAKTGWFDSSNGTAPISQQITGVGFEPDALLFGSAVGSSGLQSHHFQQFGASDGASEWTVCSLHQHNLLTSQAWGVHDTARIYYSRALDAGTSTRKGGKTTSSGGSIDADGFTVAWTELGSSDTQRIGWLALQEITSTLPLAGTVAAAGLASGKLFTAHPLVGTIDATGDTSGALFGDWPLAGTIAATGEAAALLFNDLTLEGAAAAAGLLSGQLTVVGDESLTGTVAAAGLASGKLFTAHSIAGTADAAGLVSGNLVVLVPLAGTISAAGTSEGAIVQGFSLAGIIGAAGFAAGNLVLEFQFLDPDPITAFGSLLADLTILEPPGAQLPDLITEHVSIPVPTDNDQIFPALPTDAATLRTAQQSRVVGAVPGGVGVVPPTGTTYIIISPPPTTAVDLFIGDIDTQETPISPVLPTVIACAKPAPTIYLRTSSGFLNVPMLFV